jgi:hypothetical protein
VPDFTTVTVTETFEPPGDSDVAAGEVRFHLTGPMHNTASGKTSGQVTRVARLDSTGSISEVLYANDDSTTTPTGREYYVEVRLVGSPSYSGYIVVPHAVSGGTAALDTLWTPSVP